MPGSLKVSVLEAEQLPSTVKDGDLVSIRVSVGKREYQTKPSQAFGGRTAPWRYEFSYSVTNLRDNLVIAALDGNEETITKSEIQTTSIIQKGLWESFFSFKGGGRLHLRLCFVLSDEERKKIETMRREALRRRGLQNLLYRNAFQMPKPVPVKPTRSFASGVTITEISANSCLYGKDDDKENHAGNISLRCTKLLEAPRDKKLPDSVNGSHAIVPFSPILDDSQVKTSISEGLLSQKLPISASCEKTEMKDSKTTEDPDKGDEAHLPANSNAPSLLLPEASALMDDLVPSTVVSDGDQPLSPTSKLVPVGTPCESAVILAVANVESPLMSPSDEPKTMKQEDLTVGGEAAGSLNDEPTFVKPEDSTMGSVSTDLADHPSLSGSLALNASTTNEKNIKDANGMVHVSDTLTDKINDGMESVKDVAKKVDSGMEAEDNRRATLTTLNKVAKSLPWKSQLKGDTDKFGFNVSKKKRPDGERTVLAAQNELVMESAASEKTEPNVVLDKETDVKKGIFGLSGRVKKWAGVALLIAGVVILGYDAIQKDLAAKESYYSGKQRDELCSVTSAKKANQNLARNSSIYPGQQIQLH